MINIKMILWQTSPGKHFMANFSGQASNERHLGSGVLKDQFLTEQSLILGVAVLPRYVIFWQLCIVATAALVVTTVRATFTLKTSAATITCEDFEVGRNIDTNRICASLDAIVIDANHLCRLEHYSRQVAQTR
jgi:hypothetical protein